MKGFQCLLLCVAFVFFIIALPTYLCGCHDVIQPNCFRYSVQNTTIINHEVEEKTCSECAVWERSCSTSCTGSGKSQSCSESCHDYCSVYNYYSCYDSYAIAAFNFNGNRTCKINVVAASTNYDHALNKAKDEYIEGSVHEMYINKNTYGCYTTTNVEALAITGFTFFILTGLVLLCFVTSIIYSFKPRIKLIR